MLFLVLILFFFILSPANGLNGNPVANLTYGKNNINLTNQQSFYANQLILLNPDIEVISYYDPYTNRDVYYVNAFGGVGRNFLINSGVNYEVYVKKNLTLEVP